MTNYELEIYNAIHELGIPAHVLGYRYIKSAMNYLHDNPNSIYAITKELYPAVAKMHDTTGTRVERGIRHALSLSRADDEVWLRILGRIGPIANGEFLASLNEVVKIKLALENEKVEGLNNGL